MVLRLKRTDKLLVDGRRIRAANLIDQIIKIKGQYCMIAGIQCVRCGATHVIQTTENDVTLVCHCGKKLHWETNMRMDDISLYPRRGKLVAIVGKGKSAPYYEKLDLVIGINEAVTLIDTDIPVILARGDTGSFLPASKLTPNITPILPKFLHGIYKDAYYFDYVKDLGMPRRLCTVCYAIALACYLGAEQIRMYGFDALAHNDFDYIVKNDYNNAPLCDQKPQLRALPFEMINKCLVMDRPPCNLVRLVELL